MNEQLVSVISSVSAIIFTIVSYAIGYGIIREKVGTMERRVDNLEEDFEADAKERRAREDEYVRVRQFDAASSRDDRRITDIQIAMKETQSDIKKILIILSGISKETGKEFA